MDPCYKQKAPQTTDKDATFELLKKLGKFIMWFCVFTFFLSNPSWVSFFLHSFISHVSSFPSHLLAHINNKNYIFLLCNGILVILAKSSRKLINGNSVTSTVANEAPRVVEQGEEEREIPKVLQNHGVKETELEVKENEFLMEETQERQKGEENSNDEWCVEVEKDLAEEGSIAGLTTEELNRKFEEFIRRMKEEIRIEAQQQLVMV